MCFLLTVILNKIYLSVSDQLIRPASQFPTELNSLEKNSELNSSSSYGELLISSFGAPKISHMVTVKERLAVPFALQASSAIEDQVFFWPLNWSKRLQRMCFVKVWTEKNMRMFSNI